MDKLVNEPEAPTYYLIPQIVESVGTEGAEPIMWLAMCGAQAGGASRLVAPISL